MSTISLPTSCLLDKNVVRESLRGLVHATLGMPLPPRQGTSLGVVRALIAHGGLLYITPELWHLLERPANLSIASPFLSYLRVLRPGRYLKRWGRRLTEEGFSHEDAMILPAGCGERGGAMGTHSTLTPRGEDILRTLCEKLAS